MVRLINPWYGATCCFQVLARFLANINFTISNEFDHDHDHHHNPTSNELQKARASLTSRLRQEL